VQDWLAAESPDVLALQETKIRDEDFPADAFRERGYEVSFSGQPAYNGVALIAREPLADVVTGIDGLDDSQRRVLAATVGGVRIWNLYVPNGQSVGSDKYQYKLGWFAALRKHIAADLEKHERCVLVGDFNVAPEDRDVHDPEAWRGQVLCSEPERAALKSVSDLGLVDVFRNFEQEERSYSWWDYRQGAFRRNMGLRIDLILASRALASACTACRIDKAPRKHERPSDHAPVVAVFEPLNRSALPASR
jgi:exodeoxyribonuclease-3